MINMSDKTYVIRSAQYEKNIAELDDMIITLMAIKIVEKYPDMPLNQWENVKWAMDSYIKITGKIPGHIGAVSEALIRKVAEVKEARKGKTGVAKLFSDLTGSE